MRAIGFVGVVRGGAAPRVAEKSASSERFVVEPAVAVASPGAGCMRRAVVCARRVTHGSRDAIGRTAAARERPGARLRALAGSCSASPSRNPCLASTSGGARIVQRNREAYDRPPGDSGSSCLATFESFLTARAENQKIPRDGYDRLPGRTSIVGDPVVVDSPGLAPGSSAHPSPSGCPADSAVADPWGGSVRADLAAERCPRLMLTVDGRRAVAEGPPDRRSAPVPRDRAPSRALRSIFMRQGPRVRHPGGCAPEKKKGKKTTGGNCKNLSQAKCI